MSYHVSMEVVAVMHLRGEHIQHCGLALNSYVKSGMFSNDLASVGLSARLVKPDSSKRADGTVQSSYLNKGDVSSVKLLPTAISLWKSNMGSTWTSSFPTFNSFPLPKITAYSSLLKVHSSTFFPVMESKIRCPISFARSIFTDFAAVTLVTALRGE